MHPAAARIDVAGIEHVDSVAGACEADVEEPPALAASGGQLIAPGQTPEIETDHDHNVVLAPLCGVQRQQVQMQRRPIAATKVRKIEIGERSTDRQSRRHAIDLLTLISETRLSRHQRIKHSCADCRDEIPSESLIEAKRP